MTLDPHGATALDYLPCRYGASRLLFRGPQRPTDGNHVVVLGGTETYGRFIAEPFPDLLEQATGRPVLNLGQPNAGVDVFANDRAVLDLCSDASATVIQVTGAQNISNRFYAVHPRRNDRFLRASALLETIYREIDFTEYNFTGHLLNGLRHASPEKFSIVEAELKEAWITRMEHLVARIGGPVILLWMADYRPDGVGADPLSRSGPSFVDAAMIERLRGSCAEVVEVVADANERAEGYHQMHFSEIDAPAAATMLGPVVHRRAARLLAAALSGL